MFKKLILILMAFSALGFSGEKKKAPRKLIPDPIEMKFSDIPGDVKIEVVGSQSSSYQQGVEPPKGEERSSTYLRIVLPSNKDQIYLVKVQTLELDSKLKDYRFRFEVLSGETFYKTHGATAVKTMDKGIYFTKEKLSEYIEDFEKRSQANEEYELNNVVNEVSAVRGNLNRFDSSVGTRENSKDASRMDGDKRSADPLFVGEGDSRSNSGSIALVGELSAGPVQ